MKLTGVPPSLMKPIAQAYGASQGDDGDYLTSCSGDDIPNLQFTFGEGKIIMKPKDLFQDLGDVNNKD